MALSTVVLNYTTGLLYPNRRGFSRLDLGDSVRCVIYQGGAEVKNSVPLFVFPTKALGRGHIPRPPFGALLEIKFERKKVNEKEIVFPCVGPLLMYGADCSGNGGRT